AAVIVLAVALSKTRPGDGQSQWQGMTEDEARQRLDERLPSKMPAPAKAALTEKIVGQMKDKGVVIDLTDDAMAAESAAAVDDGAAATG
ncbi:MAG: hypothetical protein AAGC53_23680, partial [Actinomycetota bacterium]